MRKVISILALCLGCLVFSPDSGAQIRFGLSAGVTSQSLKFSDIGDVGLYNVGAVLKVPLVAGFAVQPGVFYQRKGGTLGTITKESSIDDVFSDTETVAGYLEVPVQLQWGPDLVLFRPYVFLEPFVGCMIYDKDKLSSYFTKDSLSKWEYGLSIGGGLEVWRLQLSLKYFWNLNNIRSDMTWSDAYSDATSTIRSTLDGDEKFSGMTISVAFMF